MERRLSKGPHPHPMLSLLMPVVTKAMKITANLQVTLAWHLGGFCMNYLPSPFTNSGEKEVHTPKTYNKCWPHHSWRIGDNSYIGSWDFTKSKNLPKGLLLQNTQRTITASLPPDKTLHLLFIYSAPIAPGPAQPRAFQEDISFSLLQVLTAC